MCASKLIFVFPFLTFATLWHLKTINQNVDYMARGFMSFMQGVDITRAIGRVGLKVEPVLGLLVPKQATPGKL